MEEKINFRAIIEVAGKPKEHVEKSLQEYIQKLRSDDHYLVTNEDLNEAEERTDQAGMWGAFAELELEVATLQDLTTFCLDYMPSMLEIIQPSELKIADKELSNFLSDLQAKLHQVDLVAKAVKMENTSLKKSLSSLIRNYVVFLLTNANLTSEQLSRYTGLSLEALEDFLDQLIDDGRIDLKEGIYFLVKENGNKHQES